MMSPKVRKQYDEKTFHPEITGFAFGLLEAVKISSKAHTIIQESGICPYIKQRSKMVADIEKAIKIEKEEDKLNLLLLKLNRENTTRTIEMITILSHLLQTKKPLSYKLVSYDQIKLNVPQKFIIAMNGGMSNPPIEDITLITGTEEITHIDHLTKFITDHINQNPGTLLEHIKNIGFESSITHPYSRALLENKPNLDAKSLDKIIQTFIHNWTLNSVNNLRGGWFEKIGQKKIHIKSGHGTYGITSNTTALGVFSNLFPDCKITANID